MHYQPQSQHHRHLHDNFIVHFLPNAQCDAVAHHHAILQSINDAISYDNYHPDVHSNVHSVIHGKAYSQSHDIVHCSEHIHTIHYTHTQWQLYGEPEPDGHQPGDLHPITDFDWERDVSADCNSHAHSHTPPNAHQLVYRNTKCQWYHNAPCHSHRHGNGFQQSQWH